MRKFLAVLPLLLLAACAGLFPQSQAAVTVEVPVTIPVTIPVTVEVTVPPVTATQAPPMPVAYYSFASLAGGAVPAGSVAILPGSLVLSPAFSPFTRSGDPATDVFLALQAAINDPRSPWQGDNLKIDHVGFDAGQVTVLLSGEMYGTGDVVLIAARWQLLLTIFANENVSTASVTLNGECVANLGISHESQAQPPDYVFTRQEIESFMAQNAHN